MYEVIFDEKAVEFLNKLPKELRKRIYDKIISTKSNPFHYFERLEGIKNYKLRVGDYRVIADISSNKIEITIVGHRRNVYKNI